MMIHLKSFIIVSTVIMVGFSLGLYVNPQWFSEREAPQCIPLSLEENGRPMEKGDANPQGAAGTNDGAAAKSKFRPVNTGGKSPKLTESALEKESLHLPSMQSPPSIEHLAEESPVILVTGGAGFIGYHFIDSYLRSFKDSNARFIALDNFNSYYDPALKRMRAARLNVNHGIEVIEGDTCDRELVHNLLQGEGVTHIVHLAAQPGVGYSLKHPQEYIRSNLLCEVEMLEEVRSQQTTRNSKIPFVYASSSSVYGGVKQYPFDEGMSLLRQINIYGASKVGQENIARAYYTNFDIPVLGLRFFTVYGPFGRPDMAVAKWSEWLLKGEKTVIYETKDKGSVKRDFTYVHDIVNGIFGSVLVASEQSYPARLPGMVFNVGHGKPESIKEMMTYLIRYCGLEGTSTGTTWQKLPKAEMETTFANTTLLETLTGIKPKVALKDGVYAAALWYKEYLYPEKIIFLFAPMDSETTRKQIERWYDYVHMNNLRVAVFYNDLKDSFLQNKETGNIRFIQNAETTDKASEVYKQHLVQLKLDVVAHFLLPRVVLQADISSIPNVEDPFQSKSALKLCRLDQTKEDFPYQECL